jgi:Toprim-like
VSRPLPGADYRGFYAALGIELPGWAHTEAPVRCFADPDAHAHGDRDASCSINVHSGLFNCHGCGAAGGPYDAATARGRTPREAMDLLVAYGLAQRRPRRDPSRVTSPASTRDTSPPSTARRTDVVAATPRRAPAPPTDSRPRVPLPAARRTAEGRASSFSVTLDDVRRWTQRLCDDRELLARVRRDRGWERETLREMGVGFDGERITVPIAASDGALQGLLRLRVDGWQRPKVLAAPGTRLGLIPYPRVGERGRLVLVEGPSDMLAARSAGVAAIAVSGTHAWRAQWARAFAGQDVTVVMDSDRAGRDASRRIARDLERHGALAAIADLDPRRDDGYDLSDWLRGGHKPSALPTAHAYVSEGDAQAALSARGAAPRAISAAAPPASRTGTAQPGAVQRPSPNSGGVGWRAF